MLAHSRTAEASDANCRAIFLARLSFCLARSESRHLDATRRQLVLLTADASVQSTAAPPSSPSPCLCHLHLISSWGNQTKIALHCIALDIPLVPLPSLADPSDGTEGYGFVSRWARPTGRVARFAKAPRSWPVRARRRVTMAIIDLSVKCLLAKMFGSADGFAPDGSPLNGSTLRCSRFCGLFVAKPFGAGPAAPPAIFAHRSEDTTTGEAGEA